MQDNRDDLSIQDPQQIYFREADHDNWTITGVDNQNNIYSTGFDGRLNYPNSQDNLVITPYQLPGYNTSYVSYSWTSHWAHTQDAVQYGNGYSI